MSASLRAHAVFVLCFVGFAALCCSGFAARGQASGSFASFLQELWPEAEHRGITRATFDVAFAGLAPDPNVLAAMRREPEYGKPMGAYLAGLVSPGRRVMSGALAPKVFDAQAIERAAPVQFPGRRLWTSNNASIVPGKLAARGFHPHR